MNEILERNAPETASPQFDLRAGDIYSIKGRNCFMDRRLDGVVSFIDVENKDFHRFTDQKLAFLSAAGDFRFVMGPFTHGVHRGPIPNRITLCDAQLAEAQRKLAYIDACLNGHLESESEDQYYEFKRSRATLEPIIARVASYRKEKPCHFNTVLGWIDRWLTLGELYGKSALVNRHYLKGNRASRLDSIAELAIERGLWRWLRPKMKTEMAYAKVVSTIAAYKRKLRRLLTEEQLELIETPSYRTFQRRCAEVDKYTRDFYRKGADYANRVHKISRQQALPDRPYEWVDVDHCTLDIVLLDEDAKVRLGRPDLIIFRCRATGMIVGYSIGWEAPSYASLLAGLRNVMYPKDLMSFPAVTKPWNCYGRIGNLGVDNALHFLGDDLREACRELQIEKPRFRPRCPWLKGALERFFGSLNTGLVHHVPGTTLSNILQRNDHDNLGEPILTLKEFESLLVYWIVMLHNERGSKGLGVIRGLGDVPSRLWNEKAANYPAGPLPPPELFIALAGEWEMRTIQGDGITWDYLKYECAQLLTLTTHARHQSARENGRGTRYKCCRDPEDISRIYVEDPYNKGTVIVVPVTASQSAYAEKRHRHSHNVVVAQARRMLGEAIDFAGILTALDHLGDALAAIRGKRDQKFHRKLARYIGDQNRERLVSKVTAHPLPSDGSGFEHLDPIAAGAKRVRSKSLSEGAPAAPTRLTPASIEAKSKPDDSTVSHLHEPDDDLAALKAAKNWSASDDYTS